MDVREKLVELLAGCPCESDCEGMVGSCPNRKNGNCNEIFKLSYCAVSKLAQHLISHGVMVQEQNGCEHCRAASYTENPFTIITQTGREVKTQFNFCPNCGRRLPQPQKGE